MQKLLELLKLYPAANIYRLAPKDYVYRGFDYFQEKEA